MYSAWRWPQIEGLSDFEGKLCHTANYDPDLNVDGKRVAVIGIGSSGVQVIPFIAPKVAQLYTWVRSSTWITPGFAQKFAGAGGKNFKCQCDYYPGINCTNIHSKIPKSKRKLGETTRWNTCDTARASRMSLISDSSLFLTARQMQKKPERYIVFLGDTTILIQLTLPIVLYPVNEGKTWGTNRHREQDDSNRLWSRM